MRQPTSEYAELHEAIKGLGGWWHHLESAWLVKHAGPSSTIRDTLSKHLRSGDKLLVLKLEGGWASWGLPEKGNAWLKENL